MGKKPSLGDIAMFVDLSPSPLDTDQQKLFPATANPAVAHCQAVWLRVHDAAMKRGAHKDSAGMEAAQAYRRAMPLLAGYQNACDFIACVGFAMLMNIISETSAGKLLYAAQVALSSAPRPPKTPTGSAA